MNLIFLNFLYFFKDQYGYAGSGNGGGYGYIPGGVYETNSKPYGGSDYGYGIGNTHGDGGYNPGYSGGLDFGQGNSIGGGYGHGQSIGGGYGHGQKVIIVLWFWIWYADSIEL